MGRGGGRFFLELSVGLDVGGDALPEWNLAEIRIKEFFSFQKVEKGENSPNMGPVF